MKNALSSLAILIAIASSALAGSIKVTPGPTLNKRGGEEIPLAFTASGFPAGTVAQIWTVNAKTWQQEDVIAEIPIVNGNNAPSVQLGWSWWKTGPYVFRIVVGNSKWTTAQIVNTRSAVIWPYPGTVYPKNRRVAVTWVNNCIIQADLLRVSLFNELTGEFFEVCDSVEPSDGQLIFTTPDVTGNRFRVVLEGFLLIFDDEASRGGELTYWYDASEICSSGLISIQ